MFDVRRSSFKTTPCGINAICEHLQNNLALTGFPPPESPLKLLQHFNICLLPSAIDPAAKSLLFFYLKKLFG